MVDICGDAATTKGPHTDVDPDNTGRRATTGPGRPTEDAALDPARDALQHQLNVGIRRALYAIVCVRGTTAALDGALALWEGEEAPRKEGTGGFVKVVTGPQSTAEQREALAELAGLLGLTPAVSADIEWWRVDALFVAPGWDTCPVALADVQLANAFCVPVDELPV